MLRPRNEACRHLIFTYSPEVTVDSRQGRGTNDELKILPECYEGMMQTQSDGWCANEDPSRVGWNGFAKLSDTVPEECLFQCWEAMDLRLEVIAIRFLLLLALDA